MSLHRLRRPLARGARGGQQTEPSATPPASVPGESRDAAQRLVASGLVDREFYSTMCGRDFESDLDAAAHLLAEGLAEGLTCNPLLEPSCFPKWLQEMWLDGRVLRFVPATSRGNLERTSPLFHVPTWVEQHPEATKHRGGPLAHFLAQATADTPMPVGPDFAGAPDVTWGEARAALLERATEFHRHSLLHAPRYWADWDESAHADFVDRMLSAAVPSFGDRPAVSVVIPVKNRPVPVAEAIRSVQKQTLTDWELLVVDDGSTDSTPDVLRELAAEDPRIHVLTLETSQGAGSARNLGVDEARGHYLAFLDSDNTWEPNFLQVCVAAAHGESHRFVYAAAQVSSTGDRQYLAFDGGLDALMIMNHITMITFVAEASLVREAGRFDPSLRRWIDFDLIIRMAKLADPQFLPFVGARYDNTEESDDRITRSESPNWRFKAFGKNLVDWDEVASTERVPGRTSVLLATHQEHRHTIEAVTAVLATAADEDVEVVVVDHGSDREVTALLAASFLGDTRVSVLRLPRRYGLAGGSNVAFAHSTGARVVFLGNDTLPRPGWLRPLLDRLDDEHVLGASALLLDPTDTVVSAGSAFLADRSIPSPFLRGHPREDAACDDGRSWHAVSGGALAMRAEDVVALEGFDPLFVNGMEDADLCLRAAARRPGTFQVVHESLVTQVPDVEVVDARPQENRRLFLRRWRDALPLPETHRYDDLGVRVAHLGGSDERVPMPRPVLVRPERTVDDGPRAGVPALRWAINIGSPGGPVGEFWGDTHFAAALAEGLRGLGQEVVTIRRGAERETAGHLDQVSLTLRGLARVSPRPGHLNILWVISHPDLVTADEVREFDLVFAASTTWARLMSARAGVPVHTLHQATNPRLFHPDATPGSTDEILFVGSARRTTGRKVVDDALEAGLPLSVYGRLWEGRLPDGVQRGEFLDNASLAGHYSSAAVVLNDHWEDMARLGFLNNRLFDAVASGGYVVSDHVEGIEELFHGMVQTYRTPEDLARLCSPEVRARLASPERRREVAEIVRREHSFAQRAETLLDAALEARAVSGTATTPS